MPPTKSTAKIVLANKEDPIRAAQHFLKNGERDLSDNNEASDQSEGSPSFSQGKGREESKQPREQGEI